MSSTSDRRWLRGILPALAVAGTVAGCAEPDLYFDRRDTISFHAGDAIASNIAVQTIDPWPRASANRNIPANGDRMQAAGERYRTGRVTPLRGLSTSSIELAPSGGDGGDAPAVSQ